MLLWLSELLARDVRAFNVFGYLTLRGRAAPTTPFTGIPEPAPPPVVTWGAAADFADLRVRIRVARGVTVEPETVAGAVGSGS